jgi:hypothetical protein
MVFRFVRTIRERASGYSSQTEIHSAAGVAALINSLLLT